MKSKLTAIGVQKLLKKLLKSLNETLSVLICWHRKRDILVYSLSLTCLLALTVSLNEVLCDISFQTTSALFLTYRFTLTFPKHKSWLPMVSMLDCNRTVP